MMTKYFEFRIKELNSIFVEFLQETVIFYTLIADLPTTFFSKNLHLWNIKWKSYEFF